MAKVRILVVEDNADNLELVRFLLDYAGYEVLCTTDGMQALRTARQEIIPIVALTAYTMSSDRRRALAAGCDGFIGKPIDVKMFVNEIEQYLPKDQDIPSNQE